MIEWQNGEIVYADNLDKNEKQFWDVAATLSLMQYMSQNMYTDIVASYAAYATLDPETGMTYEDMKTADDMLENLALMTIDRRKDEEKDPKLKWSHSKAETEYLTDAAANAEKVKQMMEKVKQASSERLDADFTK